MLSRLTGGGEGYARTGEGAAALPEIFAYGQSGTHSGINVSGLAREQGISRSAASQMVSKLVKKDFVRKTVSPETDNEVVLQLTASGETVRRRHEAQHHWLEERLAEILGGYPPELWPKAAVLVCGGYDSFIEEFVLQVSALTQEGYTVILFDGPGQGRALRQGLYFRPDFEKPVATVLDAYELSSCAMVGISWGGYFALRSAAFERRILAAAAYDVLTDGVEVMTHVFPQPLAACLCFV